MEQTAASSQSWAGLIVVLGAQCAVGCTCLLGAHVAFGQEAPERDPRAGGISGLPLQPPPAAFDQGIVLEGWIGGGSSRAVQESGWSGNFTLGVTGLYHYQWLELGAGGTVQTTIFGPTSTILSALVGGKIEPAAWLRFELLAEGGANFVSGAGTDLLESALRDDEATLPYLGGRAGVSLLLGRSRRFVLGWWGTGGSDIGQATIHPVIQSCLIGCSQNQETFTIGGPSWGTGLRVGGEISRW